MSPFSVSRDLYGSKSASDVTSELYGVQDAQEITLFIRGSPSTTTVEGTNADLLSSTLTENTTTGFSVLTTHLRASGDGASMLNVEPGFSAIRTVRSETTEVRLHLQNRTR